MVDRKATKREVRRAGGSAPRATARRTAPGFRLTTRWAAALLALLVMTFFHALVFEGKTFVSPDTTAPAGFVRMGEKALWEERTYPLWNPYVFLGMPSFGSGAYNPLIYPPDWPVAVAQKVLPLPDMTWMLLYYFLGGLFLYLLAIEWGASPFGALLGGAAFAFTPNLVAVGSHGHGSQLVDSAYLPALVWLTTRWLRRGGLHHLAWLALAGGFQLLRGHVQICFYTWLAVAIYVVVEMALAAIRRSAELRTLVVRGAGVAAAAGLAFGLAGFYNLPLRDYARWSIRTAGAGGGLGMERATAWSLSPLELPTLVIPGWAGFGGATYWGDMPFTDYPNAYVGMVAALLLLPAFLRNGAPRIFALGLAVISLFVAFGNHFPLYGFLYDHLPMFNKFRIPVMIILLTGFAVSLGVAWGWSAVVAPPGEGKPRALDRVLLAAVGLALIAFLAGAAAESWREPYVRFAVARKGATLVMGRSIYDQAAATAAWAECARSLVHVGIAALLASVVAWFAARRKIPATLATAIVLAVLLTEVWPVGARVMAPVVGDRVPHSLDAGRDDVVEFLEKAGPPGSFRIEPHEASEFQNNRYAGFGIASLGGYHAAKPRLIQEFLDRDLRFNMPWMRLLNIRYVVTHEPPGQVPEYFRSVFEGSAQVLEFLPALPRAHVVGAARVVRPAAAILDSVASDRWDPATVAFLEEDPGVPLGPVTTARAQITSYRLNDVVVDVEIQGGPGLLRLADLWYPDWVATVDGRPAKILKTDYLLRGVIVPAGRHRVEFHFRSPAVRQGLMLSLASLALILLGFGVSAWLGRRARRAEVPGVA